ncbi:cytochrome P450 [Nonomuraea sp. NPDC002799]
MHPAFTLCTAPGALPLLGHARQLRADPLGLLASLPGHGDIVRVMFGPKPVYVLCRPELVHEMLVGRARDFGKGGPFVDRLRAVAEDGLFIADGADHRCQRRMTQPAFHPDRIAAYGTVMQTRAEALVRGWAGGEVIDVNRAMTELTMAVTVQCLLSAEAIESRLDRTAADVFTAVSIVFSEIYRRLTAPVPMLRKLDVKAGRRYARAEATLRNVVEQIIAERRHDPRDRGDLVSMLLTTPDERTGRPITAALLHDQIKTFLLGGVETTAGALSWTLLLLDQNPESRRRLYAEVDNRLHGRPVRAADLPTLAYTRAVVNESLRLYPPVWVLTRTAKTRTTLGGHAIAAGAHLAYSPYLLHRDPRGFPDPERFDPGRWLGERGAAMPRGAAIPFGAGNRKCIADAFALTNAMIALATIAQHRRLSRPASARPVRPRARITLRPDFLHMTVEARFARPHPKGNEMTLSTLQRKNIAATFDVFDANRNGTIEYADFARKADKMCQALASEPGSPAHQAIHEAYLGWWDHLRRSCDSNADGTVRREEFVVAVANGMTSDPDYLDQTLKTVAEALFLGCDPERSGVMSLDVYLKMYDAVNIDRSIGQEVFKLMDQDGDGLVTCADFVTAMIAMFAESDPTLPGPRMFGHNG